MVSKSVGESGNFTVEFALILSTFIFIFLFSGDLVYRLVLQGKIDRTSYSLVNIIKARTQFFGRDGNVTSTQANTLYQIAINSFHRNFNNFDENELGLIVESQTFWDIAHANSPKRYILGGLSCTQPTGNMSETSVVTSWGRQAPVYRVTICYKAKSMLGSLAGHAYPAVYSSSVMIGR